MFNPFISFFRTIGLFFTGRIHFPGEHVGEIVDDANRQGFKLFRYVIIDPGSNQPTVPGAVFHVHFRITGMTPGKNKVFSLIPIPFIIGLPGFRSKQWLVDEATGDYQGIYKWDSVLQAEKYARSFAMRFMLGRAVKGSVWYRISSLKKAEGACDRRLQP